MPDNETTVFISYHPTNYHYALAVYQQLMALGGNDVFLHVDGLQPAEDAQEFLFDHIEARAHCLVLLTLSAVSGWDDPTDGMRQCVEVALDTERNIIPVWIDGFTMAQAKAYLPDELAALSDYDGVALSAQTLRPVVQQLHEKFLQEATDITVSPLSDEAVAFGLAQRAAASALPAVTANQLSSETWFEKAFQSAEEKRYKEAIATYAKALRLHPKSATIYHYRGIVYRQMKHYDKALQDVKEALKIAPNYAEAYLNRGNIHSAMKIYPKALEDYDKAITLNPNALHAYYNRALALTLSEYYEDALEDYNVALELHPAYAHAYNNRGIVKIYLGDEQGAREDFEAALRLDATHENARDNLQLLDSEG